MNLLEDSTASFARLPDAMVITLETPEARGALVVLTFQCTTIIRVEFIDLQSLLSVRN